MGIIKNAFNDVKRRAISFQPHEQKLLRKYLEGNIQNPIMATSRRPAYRAIVSSKKGGTDFTNIQRAIDYVDELGGGNIFIRIGTYSLSAFLTMRDNIDLIGEDKENTILDFGSAGNLTNGAIQARGTNVTSAGTITATNADATITGASTQFSDDSVVAGDIININGVPYEVYSVANNTSLELTQIYRGETTGGIPCRIDRPIKNIKISNFTIGNGADASTPGDGISLLRVQNATISDCVVENCVDGLEISSVYNLLLESCIPRYNTSDGISVTNIFSGSITKNYCYNNSAEGIITQAGGSNPLVISQNICIGNGASGIRLLVADENLITNNMVIGNLSYGIWLEGADTDVVSNNIIVNNGDDGIRLMVRVAVDCTNCIIEGNMIKDNDGHAVELTADTSGNLVHGNILNGNTTNSISDGGLGNSVVDNH